MSAWKWKRRVRCPIANGGMPVPWPNAIRAYAITWLRDTALLLLIDSGHRRAKDDRSLVGVGSRLAPLRCCHVVTAAASKAEAWSAWSLSFPLDVGPTLPAAVVWTLGAFASAWHHGSTSFAAAASAASAAKEFEERHGGGMAF